ncbi:MAG: hypothetical protein KDF49_01150, partial [Nitrosomonas sp.]|nr:hypothetical protein [Nitrosomonas sp.]
TQNFEHPRRHSGIIGRWQVFFIGELDTDSLCFDSNSLGYGKHLVSVIHRDKAASVDTGEDVVMRFQFLD